MGWVYSFKFYIGVNDKAKLLVFLVTLANRSDHTSLISDNFLKKIFRRLYADKVYFSKEYVSLLFNEVLHSGTVSGTV